MTSSIRKIYAAEISNIIVTNFVIVKCHMWGIHGLQHCQALLRHHVQLFSDPDGLCQNLFHFKSVPRENGYIVLVKMFLQWFFANKRIIITSTALKLCDVTDAVMTY